MSVHDDVVEDLTKNSYLVLHNKYVAEMAKELGNKEVSDLPLNSPYWDIQRKLTYLHALNQEK